MTARIDKATEAAGDSLPAYTEAPPYAEAAPQASTSTPAVPPQGKPPDYKQASVTPYVPIPTTLYGMSGTRIYRGLHLCAAPSDRDRLFYAEHHTGLSRSGPLGNRPGVHLHNGLDGKAPVLSAAGYRSQPLTMQESLRELCNVVILPPPMTAGAAKGTNVGSNMTNVLMEPSGETETGPLFRLTLDVGSGSADQLRPAKFAWCKLDGKEAEAESRGSSSSSSSSGFKLVRKLFRAGEKFAAPDGPRCDFPKTEDELTAAENAGESTTGDAEVVAVLLLASALKPWGQLFRLEMRGSAAAGLLGERCAIMIVTTALKLHQMHTQGKTNRSFLAMLGGRKGKSRHGGGGNRGEAGSMGYIFS
ncbi:hypothetical protein PWT90_04026 [Aphanocladium album]|nr:hypothetical protein PWT90_04026 [Aphanocladium album]